MKKRDIILFFISSLKNKIFIAILILFLLSMGGIILSTHNNFSSNNLNNKTILAQKEIKQNPNDNKIDKNSISNSNLEIQVSAIKRNYLNELNEINEKANVLINGNINDTQYQINQSSVQVYNLWNNELNKIYSSLKTTLTSEEMLKLQKEEINWIIYKEKIIKKDSVKNYEGGSVYDSALNIKLANLTKERCYYLVNNYIKV